MTHVRGRADGHAGARERLTFDPGRSERDAEVGDDRMPAFEQDVLRLDVPVDHAAAVRVAQGIRHLPRDGQGVVQRELLLAVHAGAQGLALHQRHHVEEPSARLAGIVQRQDMWMPQVRGGLDLALEPLAAQEFPAGARARAWRGSVTDATFAPLHGVRVLERSRTLTP